MPAPAAKHGFFFKIINRPNPRFVVRAGCMALVTREPFIAAIELNGDDVRLAVVMGAARLQVDINPENFFAGCFSHHYLLYLLYLPIWYSSKYTIFGKMK